MATHKVYIDGAVGTTGLQIHSRLENRSEIEVISLPEEHRKSLPHRLEAIAKADASVLCLPDAAAKEIAAAALGTAKICDASTAHRTNPAWVYGFAELLGQREKIAASARTAVPGCHASGFVALAAPLVYSGAIDKSTLLTCHSITGYSGGGKAMIAEYEDPARGKKYSAPRQYALGMAHKHLPEMQAVCSLASPPAFCPIVADYYSGMLVSVPISTSALTTEYNTPEKLARLYQQYYENQPLIKVMAAGTTPPDGTLAANALSGKDTMEIWVLGNEETVLLAARFDNLGKGASGAAVQCLNLMLGLDETAGLRL